MSDGDEINLITGNRKWYDEERAKSILAKRTSAPPVNDDRNGRPSASSMGRLEKCPGSWRLIQALPVVDHTKVEHEEPAYLQLGNACHEYLFRPTDEKYEALTSEGQWMVRKCQEIMGDAMVMVGARFGGDNWEVIKEQRLWSRSHHRYSGQADIMLVDRNLKIGAVFDYKTGRMVVDEADQNYQLRTLATLMAVNYPVTTVLAGVIQPRSEKPLTVCEYDGHDLAVAEGELSDLMREIIKQDAPLNPGDWCAFCPARAHCPALGGQLVTLVNSRPEPQPISLESVPAVQLAEVMNMAKRGRAFFDAVEDRIKEMLKADPNSVPGWTLTPDVTTSSIDDCGKAYELLSELMEPEQFTSACKVTMGKLEDAFHGAVNDGGSKAEHRKLLRNILGPVLVHGTRSGSLKKATTNDQTAAVADQATTQGALPDVQQAVGEVPGPM